MKNPETSRKTQTWRSNCLCTCLMFISTESCTSPKTNMAMENTTIWSDIFPVLRNGDVRASHVGFVNGDVVARRIIESQVTDWRPWKSSNDS